MLSQESWDRDDSRDIKPAGCFKMKMWAWLTVPLVMAALLWLWHTQWASPWLTVRNSSGSLMFFNPLPEGQEFGIRFTHSVALSPVEEWFAAEDGRLALQRTVYQDFGAGLPHDAAEGQRMTVADGRIVLSGFSLTLSQMEVRVGRVAEHQLLLGGARAHESESATSAEAQEPTRVFPLVAWAPPGAALRFAVEVPPLRERVLAYFR